MNILYITVLLGSAFLLQSIFGFLQVKNFVKVFRKMCKNGKVLIGKNPKKFKVGTLLLLNIDAHANILQAQIMTGVTIFARFKNLSSIEGKSLPLLASSYDELNKYDKLTKECILNAYRNFINFKTGKMSREDLDTSTNFLSLPVFSLWESVLINKFYEIKGKRKL
ncbi:transcriptional regulator GutM [Lactobacillus sp. ESL0230]|uniref:transcriptional regulator GutM n=1 Tax=Lactobacillus sp. ESL0230 TaxID=2069353 RepID=UPI000EFBE50C|nr:transcriptional regulator GutM [Lactobacillus sp. ESL0230]RMC46089.1 transcriptional regulator [Lactobacillus sp. ESL0230]